jgi:NADH:ubiquinone oxidoreductase subunit 5 (subunit L)/multisubunit Na+/H+ antiporter MnhA subunit
MGYMDVKRVVAYSTMVHVGVMVMGLGLVDVIYGGSGLKLVYWHMITHGLGK